MSEEVLTPVNGAPSLTGTMVVDENKTVVYVDAGAASLLGTTIEDLMGKRCSNFRHLLPCAEEACSLDSPCRFLSCASPQEIQIRTNSQCSFESHIAVDAKGDRVGVVHVVTLPKRRAGPQPENDAPFHGLVGRDHEMMKLFELIELVAPTDVTVHIVGPSGTGKELIADALHTLSDRRNKRLVKLNCSTIPTTLLESTLFGHSKGAFTGAHKDSEGYVEYADGGTLFLDEIGDVSLDVQVKLLRLLESREYSRVGETRSRTAEIRIITATNRDLRRLVADGKMREDFYYRINVFPLAVPPLAQRLSDIPLLASYFVDRFNRRFGKNILGLSSEALALLSQHAWPGNVRELQHAIEHAFVKAANGYLLPEHFPLHVGSKHPVESESPPEKVALPLSSITNERPPINAETIENALASSGRNVTKAAARLGVSRVTLWKHMKRLGIER